MPVNVVKTKRDERLWEKAKSQAARQGHADDWEYIMGVFKKMKGWRREALAKKSGK